MSIVNEEPSTDYDRFIQDGSILSKVMTSIVFNSVPLEQIDDNWGVVSPVWHDSNSGLLTLVSLEPGPGQSEGRHQRDQALRGGGRVRARGPD